MSNNKQRKRSPGAYTVLKVLILAVLVLSLSGIIYLRTAQEPDLQKAEQAAVPSVSSAIPGDELLQAEGDSSTALSVGPAPESTGLTEQTTAESAGSESPANPDTGTEPAAPATVAPAVVPEAVHGTPKRYTAETYQLVTDMVYAYRLLGAGGRPQVETALESLKQVDPQLGTLWEGIMREWARVSEELTVTPGVLPEGLPEDDSLCIAVMGYHLNADGSMLPEMEGRCEIALKLLERYPNAVLALTGGGTAPANSEATEAETMAQWFLARGIPAEKMIVENLSMTTGQNAKNTCAILTDQYAQVKEIVVVSSDYHIPQCELLFTEAALLFAYVNDCDIPYRVTGYAAFQTAGVPEEYSDPANLGADIWVMADPHY